MGRALSIERVPERAGDGKSRGLGLAWLSVIGVVGACSGGVLGAGERMASGSDGGADDRGDSPADAAGSIGDELDAAIPAEPDWGDAGEDAGEVDAGPPGVITVVQSNIECGGKYTDHACSGEVTYDTAIADHWAELFGA